MSSATYDAFVERNVRGKTSQTKEGDRGLQSHIVAVRICIALNKE